MLQLLVYTLLCLTLATNPIFAHSKREDNTDQLSSTVLARIKKTLAGNATDSWVAGTQTQALLELDYPKLSVYNKDFDLVFAHGTSKPPVQVNKIVKYWQSVHNDTDGEFIYSVGNSPTDTYAIGNAFVLASLTASSSRARADYAKSVKQAIHFIWSKRLPKLADGTISTRPFEEPVQLWNDEASMLPPFLAYYGVATKNATCIRESYKQIKLYRKYLKPKNSDLWEHIKLGWYNDTRIWATGDAWAANGMVRVASTMQNSQYKGQFAEETKDLANWSLDIVKEAFSNLYDKTPLLPNVFFRKPSETFADSSSSALVAATAYRLASMKHPGADKLIPKAHKMRRALYKKIRKDGWISDVVNPLNWSQETPDNKSPESLAFMLMLEAAWRDYRQACRSESLADLDVALNLQGL